jgi:hypothetical protein
MAAAPAEPIEALFRPSTRFRDSHGNRRGGLPEAFTELELLPGLTIESVLARGVTTWENFRRFLHDKVVWMTPDVYISCRGIYSTGDTLVLVLGRSDARTRMCVRVRSGAATAAAPCDFAVRLLAASELRSVYIRGNVNIVPPVSGETLSRFFQESRSCLHQVTLELMALSEDHCRALATMSRLDVELDLRKCSLLDDDAAGTFVEYLQSDRGPVKLGFCEIDSRVIANGLTGDSRVNKLELDNDLDDPATGVILKALANNRGLAELDLSLCKMSDDNWSILCESLKAHPTLTSLGVRSIIPIERFGGTVSERDKARTCAIADLMEHNTILQTIRLSEGHYDQQIYLEEILPRLETNRYRPRVLAVKKTNQRLFREKVLGRALHLVWMFLSENVDAFVRSEEEEESNSEVPRAVAAAVVVAAVAGSKRKR